LKKSLELSQSIDEIDTTKEKVENIIDNGENEVNNTKKEKSLSFIPKTIEKGLKDITMTLTSIVKKMDVNDMSGKKDENEEDKITKKPNEIKEKESKVESNKTKIIKPLKHDTKNNLISRISIPQSQNLKNKLKDNNRDNESIEKGKNYKFSMNDIKEIGLVNELNENKINEENSKINKDTVDNIITITTDTDVLNKNINSNIYETKNKNMHSRYNK